MMPTTYRCGHPRTEENTVGRKEHRCRTCSQAAHRRYAEYQAAFKGIGDAPKNFGAYAHMRGKSALEGRDPSVEALPKASRMLLEAILREHPHAFANYAAFHDASRSAA